MADPAAWILEALRNVSERFGWAYGYRGSLFLIAGGVFVLGVLMVLLVVRSALFGTPARRDVAAAPSVLVAQPVPPAPLAPDGSRRLAEEAAHDPETAFRLGRRAGGTIRSRSLDEALDRFAQAGLGDPRIVSTTSRRKVVQLASCRTCTAVVARGAAEFAWNREEFSRSKTAPACEFERGFLEGALGPIVAGAARVRETACRTRGDRACEFEVVY